MHLSIVERFVNSVLADECETHVWKTVNFNFSLWGHEANNVSMGFVDCMDQGVFVVMNYQSSQKGYYETYVPPLRLFKGLAQVNHKNADVATTNQLFNQMQKSQELVAEVVLDGPITVNDPFTLHFHFASSGLMVRNVLKCENILNVIDEFV